MHMEPKYLLCWKLYYEIILIMMDLKLDRENDIQFCFCSHLFLNIFQADPKSLCVYVCVCVCVCTYRSRLGSWEERWRRLLFTLQRPVPGIVHSFGGRLQHEYTHKHKKPEITSLTVEAQIYKYLG